MPYSTGQFTLRLLVSGVIGFTAVSMLGTTGCDDTGNDPAIGATNTVGGAGAAAAPVPEVDAAEAVVQPTTDYRVFTGRTSAVNSVEIRARVSGYLLATPTSVTSQKIQPSHPAASAREQIDDAKLPTVTVNEGSMVDVGTLLFLIDPEPYQLALSQAEGNLQSARALLKQNEQDLSRARELFNKNAISQAELDQANATTSQTQGQIASLVAAVETAKLNLNFTRVRSPIEGLLGQTQVTIGNLIAADSMPLTTVVSIDPIFVEFDVDEQSLLDYRGRLQKGEVKSARNSRIEVRLGLASDPDFPFQGVIDFVDNRTDPQTGNTRIRASFENPDGKLSPGLFARVRVPFTASYEGVFVPTSALGMDQQGRFVMVIKDGRVERRAVAAGTVDGDMTVIREGLSDGEVVVTSGLQKIRPGGEVTISQPVAKDEPAVDEPAEDTSTVTAPETGQVASPTEEQPQP